jgi:predicted lipid-binding transport protein (Tim44 family)
MPGPFGETIVKRFLALAVATLAIAATIGVDIADARRLGGGRSFGAQRQSVAPPASPSAPAGAPGQAVAPGGAASNPVMAPGAASRATTPGAAAAPAAAGAAARTGMGRWLGPIAGIAGILGLAWLASALGMSEALMSLLVVLLVAVAGIALLRAILARRAGANRGPTFAGAGASQRSMGGYAPQPAGRIDNAFGGGTAAAGREVSGRYPPGFEPEPFLAQARAQFTRLQAAYDAGDRTTLSDVMTPELYSEVVRDLDARRNEGPTQVVSLFADILDVSTEANEHWASVRFHGLIREDGAASPKPFDEMWNLVKPVDGSTGWLLAGIRQLDTTPAGQA